MAREAICPMFKKCGGCGFLDVEYSLQLAMKKNEIKVILDELKIPGEIKMYFKDEYYYRNRMDFSFSPEGPGQREKGKFYKVVSFEKCYIANEGVNKALANVREWFLNNKAQISVFDSRSNKGCLRYSTTRSSFYAKDTSITFILNKDSEEVDAHKVLIKKFADTYEVPNVLVGLVKHNTDVSITQDYEVIRGNDFLKERLGKNIFYFHTQGFFQNNSPVMMDMLHYVKEKLGTGHELLVDLFGGVGTFGIFMADTAKEVFIIDNDKFNIECAQKNIVANDTKNVRLFEMDAKEMKKIAYQFVNKKSVFVLDPPRVGLHKDTVKFIEEVKPKTMVYVSCNPQQLGNDLLALKKFYEVKEMAIFDMFPQTKHIESIVLLELK
ncbi:MAG: 23S rRNA (uracil(1939)-C(5))-methyltransferase RlmD [bacterium]